MCLNPSQSEIFNLNQNSIRINRTQSEWIRKNFLIQRNKFKQNQSEEFRPRIH